MKHVSWAWLLLLLPLMGCPGTTNDREGGSTTPPAPVVTVRAPAFSGDSAYYFVDRQVSFGPRVPNSAGHRQCGDYLVATLKKYGAQVTVQEFVADAYNGTKLQSRNIIGSYLPNATKRILLAAHWDTRHVADKDSVRRNEPILGASDGASGVGVLLEVARILGADSSRAPVGVDIIFFDAEDYGVPDAERALPIWGRNTGARTCTSPATRLTTASCSTWSAPKMPLSSRKDSRCSLPAAWSTRCGTLPTTSSTVSTSWVT